MAKSDSQKKIDNITSDTAFFDQKYTGYCGVASVKSILAMYGLPTKIEINFNDGTSPNAIMKILRQKGLRAVSKTISINKLKPCSIAYYPSRDHYVTIEKVEDKLLINDPIKTGPVYLTKKQFLKKWASKDDSGWVIETKKNVTKNH